MAFSKEFVADIEDALHRLRQLQSTHLDAQQRALVEKTIAGLLFSLAKWEARTGISEAPPFEIVE